MKNRQTPTPKICYTAGGILIHEKKVLLVKHKKLGIWLNPGGHIDADELPHHAAEREFFEETGILVEAIDAFDLPVFSKSEKNFSLVNKQANGESNRQSNEQIQRWGVFQPNPILTNLHWVNKESYNLRLQSENLEQRQPTKTWKRGCEQHVSFFFLLRPLAGVTFIQNLAETDGIAWFGLEEIAHLETQQNIRTEIELGFTLSALTQTD